MKEDVLQRALNAPSLRQTWGHSHKPRRNGATGANTERLVSPVYGSGLGAAREAFASAELGWCHIWVKVGFLTTAGIELSTPAAVRG